MPIPSSNEAAITKLQSRTSVLRCGLEPGSAIPATGRESEKASANDGAGAYERDHCGSEQEWAQEKEREPVKESDASEERVAKRGQAPGEGHERANGPESGRQQDR
jgi:hypothetical protein